MYLVLQGDASLVNFVFILCCVVESFSSLFLSRLLYPQAPLRLPHPGDGHLLFHCDHDGGPKASTYQQANNAIENLNTTEAYNRHGLIPQMRAEPFAFEELPKSERIADRIDPELREDSIGFRAKCNQIAVKAGLMACRRVFVVGFQCRHMSPNTLLLIQKLFATLASLRSTFSPKVCCPGAKRFKLVAGGLRIN